MTLFLAYEQAQWCAGKSVRVAELVFEKSDVGGTYVLWVSAKQGEGGRFRRHLGDECGLRCFRGFALPNRERMRLQDLLEPLIERPGRHAFVERSIDAIDSREQLIERARLSRGLGEIGRAASRARGCLRAWIWEVAVTLKKKDNAAAL